MKRKIESPSSHETSTNVGLVLYTATMILILTFFIMLTSNSVLDEKGMRKALGSLAATFNSHTGGSAPWAEKGVDASSGVNLASVMDKDLARLRTLVRDRVDEDKSHILIGSDYRILSFESALMFPSDALDIQEDMKPFLHLMAEIFRNSDYSITIEGHTDDQPPRIAGVRDNYEVSARRAIGLLRFFLEEGGIAADRLSAFGYADNRPVAANNTPQNRLRNNRIDVVLTDNAKSLDIARRQTERKDRQFGYKGFRFRLFD